MTGRGAAARSGLLLALALAVLAGGCWDYRDINDRSIVLGIAIDDAPGYARAVTAEVASPAPAGGGLRGAGGGAAGGGGTLGGRAVIRAVAGTSAHALGLQRDAWGRPFEFGHQAVWILGEAYARRGEKDEFGCAGCHPAMNTGMHFLVAQGRGADFLTGVPPEGTYSSVHLTLVAGNALERGGIPPTTRLSEFVAATEENRVALAPRLAWEGDRPRVAGAAVFRDYRLLGWLDEDETLGVAFLQGTGRRTTIEIPCPPLEVGGSVTPAPRLATFEAQGRAARLEAQVRDGRPALRYRLTVRGIAFDSGCPRAPGRRGVSGDEEKVLARAAAREIHRLALLAVRRSQAMGADFLGWGTRLRRTEPGLWRDLGGRWEEEFPRLPVEVQVEVRVRRHSRVH